MVSAGDAIRRHDLERLNPMIWPQIARRANQKNLSSPIAKNIPLVASGKSVASLRPSHPNEGRLAIVTKRAVGCGGRESCD
jgi:hypothetical protein